MKKTIFITALCCLLMTIFAAASGAAENKKRIMVFGDSNTFGYVEDAQAVVGRLPLDTAWPGRMAALLGSDYEVVVEGLSGRTTRIDSPERSGTGVIPGAGMNGAAYLPAALSSHMPLDMVVIMLGTKRFPQGSQPERLGHRGQPDGTYFHRQKGESGSSGRSSRLLRC